MDRFYSDALLHQFALMAARDFAANRLWRRCLLTRAWAWEEAQIAAPQPARITEPPSPAAGQDHRDDVRCDLTADFCRPMTALEALCLLAAFLPQQEQRETALLGGPNWS